METKFKDNKKEKVAIVTDREMHGVNISVHVYGQKIVFGNGEVLSSGSSSGDSTQQFGGEDLSNVKSVDIVALIEKAISDFKSK